MMQHSDVEFDVSAVAGAGAVLSARVLGPASGPVRSPVVVCLPGGAYTKDYWDVPEQVVPGYSFSEFASRSGYVSVVVDHIGMGASTRPPDGDELSAEFVAACHATAAGEIRARLRSGDLAPWLDAVPDALLVGIGHSNGGCVLVNQQGRHRSFDAIGVFGYSNQGMVLPYTEDEPDDAAAAAELHRTRAEEMLKTVIVGDWAPYLDFDRDALRALFYWEDVSPDVIAAAGRLHTLTPRGSSIDASVPASAAEVAATIDTPVFLGFGERDVCPDPHAEATTYRGSRDITTYVLPKAGHCTNFAVGRRAIWSRTVAWLDGLADQVTPRR